MRDGPEALDGLVRVSRETRDRLERFRLLLERWQRKTNLVGRDTLATFWTHHVGDAAFLHGHAREVETWTDMGAGAGLPGLPLAMLAGGEGRPLRVDLVESNAKKCAFQRAAVLETGLRDGPADVRIHAERLEDHRPVPNTVLTARALAPLVDLVGHAQRFGARRALFFKGERHEDEIATARSRHRFDCDVIPHPLRHGSVLLDVRL